MGDYELMMALGFAVWGWTIYCAYRVGHESGREAQNDEARHRAAIRALESAADNYAVTLALADPEIRALIEKRAKGEK